MKFDTVIIGGGLAGLVCGIKLSQQGQRCVIISSGQSALHFLSGSFDLLNTLPDGTDVAHPLDAIGKLTNIAPDHPYSKLGVVQFTELVAEAEQFFAGIGIRMKGSAGENHFRITPMGTLKHTWLTMGDYAICPNGKELPWKKVRIFNPAGFLDFYPHFIADEVRKMGTTCEVHEFNLPGLDNLRRNPSGFRSTHIARVLDKEENFQLLCDILIKESRDTEAILLPACLGLEEQETIHRLEAVINKPVYFIPTIPPSIAGIGLQRFLQDYFRRLGGIYMMGDNIIDSIIENRMVKCVYSHNHGDIPFEGKHFVLATGSYFSRGLVAGRDGIYEPVFNLEVTHHKERENWYSENIFDPQPYQQFGVKTNTSFQGKTGKAVLENLFVSGAILDGFNPIKEGTGGGVSILTALHIAGNILNASTL